ncbi:caspase family protein [Bradyrhizobium sp. 195]|uniref:caspase family protein n=1 Tax=Bradyrhizobium sp. 195 TaxID=2782662 RepID=UPI0020011CEF|nr:caspase family protein [Bradyrhizobium sp. 195]UPK25684.1 caspase family protein [Bradyrhizobium sp. 195]
MKLRQLLIYCLCLVVGAMFADAAAAERRVALIVGNSAYKNASTLSNTINDATAIGALFKSIGFEVVISRNDLGVVEFKRTVREFLITAENADMAVVYYAGHGIEISGTNYLIPVDARLSRDYDVDDEAISLDRIIWALQPVRRLRLILLDACRDNPFAAKLRSAGRTPARGGLAKLDEVGADTLVAYAAKAGSISYDGDGVNSPYAIALLRHLAEPDVDIRITLGRVRDAVIAMTGGRQEPFIYGSLGGATISLVPNTTRVAPAPPVAAAPAPPPASVPTPPKPVVVSPAPAPPTVNAAVPKPPLPAQAAPQTVDPCVRDEARLARLRANPTPEEIINFQREVACTRLRPQVQRLFESFAGDTALPSGGNPASQMVPKQQAQNESVRSEDTCARDMARLLSMRAEPTLAAITKFEKELGCERLRSQLRRLRESVTP